MHRPPTELHPMLGTGLVLDRLMWRYQGRNQHHSIEAQLKVCLLGTHEVTKMWRIERPAEDPDAH
jgi:hypothetical protein